MCSFEVDNHSCCLRLAAHYYMPDIVYYNKAPQRIKERQKPTQQPPHKTKLMMSQIFKKFPDDVITTDSASGVISAGRRSARESPLMMAPSLLNRKTQAMMKTTRSPSPAQPATPFAAFARAGTPALTPITATRTQTKGITYMTNHAVNKASHFAVPSVPTKTSPETESVAPT